MPAGRLAARAFQFMGEPTEEGPAGFSTMLAVRAFIDLGHAASLGRFASLVYMCLLRHTDGAGLSFPGQRLMGREMGLNSRSVRRGLTALEGRGGILRVVNRETGQLRPAKERLRSGERNCYELLPIWETGKSKARTASPEDETASPQGPQGLTSKAVRASPPRPVRPPKRASEVSKIKSAREAGGASSPQLAPARKCAFQSFERIHGVKPSWSTRDYAQLANLFRRCPELTAEEFGRRWNNYIQSTEAFTRKQGHGLAFFCGRFDVFIEGPLHDKATRKQGVAELAVEPRRPGKVDYAEELRKRMQRPAQTAVEAVG